MKSLNKESVIIENKISSMDLDAECPIDDTSLIVDVNEESPNNEAVIETGVRSGESFNNEAVLETCIDSQESPYNETVLATCVRSKESPSNGAVLGSEESPYNETVFKTYVGSEENPNDEAVLETFVNSGNLEENTEDQTLHTRKLAKRTEHKKHSCFFCKRVLFQLPRHWFKVHFREPEIREIMGLHKHNFQRRKKIDDLRKKGDFEYNQLNSDRENIVLRNSNVAMRKYRPCPSCLGYFSKDNLRHHKQKCSPKKGDRSLQGNSIKLTKYIHARASEMLRNQIAPNMHKDEISNNFLFDEILIVYGNFLCIKYTESHLKTHIRAQLRLLGRFMLQAKTIDSNIKCCKDLMHPSCIDTVRKAIDIVAGLNRESGIYEHPTNARTLSTEFKKILEVVLSECDKNEDEPLRKLTKAMSRRYNLELAPYINRICKLSENRFNRLKEVNSLPENQEVEDYLEYLTKGADFHVNNIKTKYVFEDWNKLCQYLLVALAVFNRKRPGEIQRIELEEFNKRACVSEKDFINLTEHEKVQADKYIRVAFRGKLGNTTALLIDRNYVLPSLEIAIRYRMEAGVHPENPYLFGFPSKDKYKTYDTYRCNRQFLEESGMNKSSLTFTNLRKHFATQVAKDGTSHEEELRISNYMSHKYSIHKAVYDQSTPLIDITTVSQRLERSAKKKKKSSDARVRNRNVGKRTAAEKKKEVESIALEKMKWPENDIEDEEYVPESDSEELEEKLMESFKGKFKHRELWSSVQKHVTRFHFKDELANDSYIHGDKIRELQSNYKEIMKNRSVPMIKQWLEGEKKKIKLEADTVNAKRSRFSTPEKEILEKSTEQHSLDGTEPSLEELQDLIDEQDMLKRRSADSLLRKFRYMQRKSKECEGHK
ncbi:hypothetical protein JTB14_021927 [Gonioctena quinquepunctata]|nr:hypothetical protein JTB14_021927 [Gonioctena quinquepunctata]